MSAIGHIHRPYSRAERLSDGVVHVLGVALAAIAVPSLITLTALSGAGGAAIVGVSVYGTTLILMLSFSALCNMVDSPRWAGLLRRLDHSAIYVKIAGTYTPFTLLSAGQAPGLLVGLWTAAAFGLSMKMVAPARLRWFALALYLAMGWAALYAGGQMLASLPGSVLVLMLVGGSIYTIGVVFFLLERLPFHNTIWHVFVLAGSVLFFIAVAQCIAHIPADNF
ncbi:PAQR family membrane homeostasis protein TrhA [Paracoccus sp. (in: a-proteobacteria)]|uniref:PAQR family membrane homeostasis protein TrhA n=1 Tax=Paracoccus sp. TaxID=267 RepID=UPI002AFE3CD8|nr:hemolysin III family protein [Paracoccus sp. (in: a-proteobacteria)]